MAKAPGKNEDGEGQRTVRRPIVNLNFGGRKTTIDADPDDEGEEGDDDRVIVDPLRRKKPASQVEFEEVDIGGKKYKVEKGAADALKKSAKKPAASDSGEIKKMLDEYTAKIAGKGKKVTEGDDEPGEGEPDLSDVRIFSDTKGWMADFKKSLSADIVKQISTMYSQDQGQKTFWQDFYRDNSDLKEYDFIVKAVLSKNAKELAPMSTEDAAEKLAELARDQLLGIAKKVSKGGKKKDGFHVEGEQSSRIRKNEDDDSDDDDEKDRKAGVPMTMSAMLKDRRSKRFGHTFNKETEE